MARKAWVQGSGAGLERRRGERGGGEEEEGGGGGWGGGIGCGAKAARAAGPERRSGGGGGRKVRPATRWECSRALIMASSSDVEMIMPRLSTMAASSLVDTAPARGAPSLSCGHDSKLGKPAAVPPAGRAAEKVEGRGGRRHLSHHRRNCRIPPSALPHRARPCLQSPRSSGVTTRASSNQRASQRREQPFLTKTKSSCCSCEPMPPYRSSTRSYAW